MGLSYYSERRYGKIDFELTKELTKYINVIKNNHLSVKVLLQMALLLYGV